MSVHSGDEMRTAEIAFQICGCKAAGASHSGNLRALWWTPNVKGAIKLKTEWHKAWLASGTTEVTHSYLSMDGVEAKT